jgi:NAD(P)-dependent dehydrogenase (short-subunit alcohol dehydrogenase family)
VTALADLTDPPALTAAVATTRAEVGPIDLLVNNAGIVLRKPTATITDGEWRQMMAINLDAPFQLIRAFADDLADPARPGHQRRVDRRPPRHARSSPRTAPPSTAWSA